MFSLLKDDFPYVYVWGGYFPPFAQDIADSFRRNDRVAWHAALASIHPDVLVLADRPRKAVPLPDCAPFDPAETPEGGLAGNQPSLRVDWERWLEPVAVPVARDKRFTLYRLKPLPPAPRAVKRVRSDVARLNPILEADLAFSGPAAPVTLSLAGQPLGVFAPEAEGTVHVRFDLTNVKKKMWSRSAPNELVLSAGDGAGQSPAFSLERFSMLGADGAYHDPCHGGTLDPAAFPAESHPWE